MTGKCTQKCEISRRSYVSELRNISRHRLRRLGSVISDDDLDDLIVDLDDDFLAGINDDFLQVFEGFGDLGSQFFDGLLGVSFDVVSEFLHGFFHFSRASVILGFNSSMVFLASALMLSPSFFMASFTFPQISAILRFSMNSNSSELASVAPVMMRTISPLIWMMTFFPALMVTSLILLRESRICGFSSSMAVSTRPRMSSPSFLAAALTLAQMSLIPRFSIANSSEDSAISSASMILMISPFNSITIFLPALITMAPSFFRDSASLGPASLTIFKTSGLSLTATALIFSHSPSSAP